eukprot:4514381-Prymnesium_polylepis.1
MQVSSSSTCHRCRPLWLCRHQTPYPHRRNFSRRQIVATPQCDDCVDGRRRCSLAPCTAAHGMTLSRQCEPLLWPDALGARSALVTE